METKVGLALSGGGAKGFAHVGVIKSLEKHGIPIHVISGVSAGALVGGMYASGMVIEEIEEVCLSSGYKEILKLIFDPSKGSGGVITGKKIDKFIKSHVKKEKIEDFQIKFVCVAADLVTGKSFYFKKGDVSIAIRASGAVPGVFKPVLYKGMYLVDGGIIEPIALNVVKELGGEINIGIDLSGYPDMKSKIKNGRISMKDTVYSSFIMMHKKLSDVVFEENKDFLRINPNVNKISAFMFGSKKVVRDTIKEGERIMDKNIPKLKDMIKNYQKK
ncbi:MAG: patatin-like phospholipase family protein [Candidatus Aenigmarchaeota archaeon]|nr:patatin-like phospholipase family protein [Candidatus Aenigmarchaeota archaeon]